MLPRTLNSNLKENSSSTVGGASSLGVETLPITLYHYKGLDLFVIFVLFLIVFFSLHFLLAPFEKSGLENRSERLALMYPGSFWHVGFFLYIIT